MQTPATVSTTPTKASPNHPRPGRSGPIALQTAMPSDGFTNAIDQALVEPRGGAPAQPGMTVPDKGVKPVKSPVLPPPLSTPACIVPAQSMQAAGSVADAGKGVGIVPAAHVADAEKDGPSASAIRTSDAALFIAQPQPAPPLCLPVSLAASHIPDLGGPNATSSAIVAASDAGISVEPLSIPAATADVTSAKQGLGQPGPSAPLPTLQGVPPPEAASTIVRSAPGRPSATATLDETAAAIVSVLEDETAILKPSLILPVATVLPPAIAAPHVVAALSARPRPSADAVQTPAEQVGPALASFAASVAQPGAPQHLTIRLDPADLGRVQVRIERIPGGPARVDLVVERPDTLLLLLRDQPQLHRALDLAGVPTAERTLQFHLAPPNTSTPDTMASQQNADPGSSQHRPDHSARQRASSIGHATALDGSIHPPVVAFQRAGIDITA